MGIFTISFPKPFLRNLGSTFNKIILILAWESLPSAFPTLFSITPGNLNLYYEHL